MPTVEFPEQLPISAKVREIAQAIDASPVVIVAGETGSGKTTQLPKICLAMGRGREGRIGVTQPRRIAATSVAARVASELGVQLGNEVGYQIRFANRTSRATYVKFMTDGILLAELAGDPLLRAYDTIILDEAHERSLNVDFLLGYLTRILPQRPELRVIVSSATLEVERFARFFGGAPVIQVSGRTFPVEVIHRPPAKGEDDLVDTIAETIEEITAIDPRGDILVFLPGEREIKDAMDALVQHALPHTVVLPLYGRLSQQEQARVFQPARERRIVLATNVAETSLTIEGIVYVVDTGLARINRYDPRTGVTRLLVEPIAKASADQRKGRAGRTRSGVCFRLWEEGEHALRPEHTDPELLRIGLAMVVLRMKSLGLGKVEAFPFLDPPSKRAIDEGYRVLEELGAIDDDGELTKVGREIARMPVDPRIGRMIVAGAAEGALREVLIVAAALGLQDPRERPLAAQQKADALHKRFRDESSDFASLVALYRHHQETIAPKPRRQQERTCRDQFLSPTRMREWLDVHRELSSIAEELGYRPKEGAAAPSEALHRAILPGFLSRIAMYKPEARQYTGARQTRFVLHPSSGLAKKPPPWIVAAELVETSQLFGRTAAKIDPEWLEVAGGKLCRASYGDPYFSEKNGEAMVREQITLYGLPIVRDRPVRLAPVDRGAARRMFIVHALVREEWQPRPTPRFVEHNRAVYEEVKRLRDRARRGEVLADEDAVAAFFERRIPDDVTSAKTFDSWRRDAEATDPKVLWLTRDDVLGAETGDLGPARFPDTWRQDELELPLAYRFEPSEDDDGVTVEVPLAVLPALDERALEWTIPGWRAEKIALLLHNLPRALKKGLGSIPELSETLAASLDPSAGGLREALSAGVSDLTGQDVPSSAWDLASLPPHLAVRVALTDGGRALGASREVATLRATFGARAKEAWEASARAACPAGPRDAFGDALAPSVVVHLGKVKARGYPALVADERGVTREVFSAKDAADRAMRGGLRKLLLAKLGGAEGKWESQVPAAIAMSSLADGGAAPRKQVVARALDEAFELDDPSSFPRTAAAFEDRFQRGKGRIAGALGELSRCASSIAAELDAVRAALKKIASQPGAPRVALDDVRSQLAYLVPPDVLAAAPRDRLSEIPRYLRGIVLRLERLPNGPQKDAQKGAELAPLWRAWTERKEALRARGLPSPDLESFRWLLEEYRIAVYAPELRPAALSPRRLAERWEEIAGGAASAR